jgi:four helix bundle protein
MMTLQRTNFEKLEVYRLAEALADEVWRIVGRWGAFERRTIGAQIVRSADGVAANIAESTGRATRRDRRHFLVVARGCLYETQNWLRRSYRRELLTPDEVEGLRGLLQALAPMLNAYIRSMSSSSTPKA